LKNTAQFQVFIQPLGKIMKLNTVKMCYSIVISGVLWMKQSCLTQVTPQNMTLRSKLSSSQEASMRC